uniref:Immunoglobulin V-set domain-containing protein n=1 Tax=Kryptolebias marmoratus TaxID=37003 RepID=A0A3Q2ZRH2_KRYMA
CSWNSVFCRCFLQCDKKKITAHIGEEFVLVCKYDSSRYLVSKKYWCRGSSRNSCQILMDTDGIAKSAKSQIFDNNRNGLFVKVTNLQIEDSDVYWIGIDKIYSDIMVSVNLVVTKGKMKQIFSIFPFILFQHKLFQTGLCGTNSPQGLPGAPLIGFEPTLWSNKRGQQVLLFCQ